MAGADSKTPLAALKRGRAGHFLKRQMPVIVPARLDAIQACPQLVWICADPTLRMQTGEPSIADLVELARSWRQSSIIAP